MTAAIVVYVLGIVPVGLLFREMQLVSNPWRDRAFALTWPLWPVYLAVSLTSDFVEQKKRAARGGK
jgi:hypothetical protein